MKARRALTLGATLVALLALAGCGLGNPWPKPPPAAPTSLRVTMFGDSLLTGSAPMLRAALDFDHQPNTVVDLTVPGSGLLDPGIHEFLADRLPADGVVVFEYVGMCSSCPATIGSPTYFSLWEDSMRTVIADTRAQGLDVVWVKPPPSINPYAQGVSAMQAAMVDRVIADLADAHVVEADWWTALGDVKGDYQLDLWYDDFLRGGSLHRVRLFDAFHLTDVGRQRASAWTAAAVIAAATA
jgi:hypothetical protein